MSAKPSNFFMAIFSVAVLNACIQYKPTTSIQESSSKKVNLTPAPCHGNREVFNITEGSSMEWKLEMISKDGAGTFLQFNHSASGFLNAIQGQLSESRSLVQFVKNDSINNAEYQILREILLQDNNFQVFQLILDKIDTKDASIGTGNIKKLPMIGTLFIGGRRAPVVFNAMVLEKDGVYRADGEVELLTRGKNAGINTLPMNDLMERLGKALKIQLSNTMRLKMKLILKKGCQ